MSRRYVKEARSKSLQVMLSAREMAYVDKYAKAEKETRSGFGRSVIVRELVRRVQEEADATTDARPTDLARA